MCMSATTGLGEQKHISLCLLKMSVLKIVYKIYSNSLKQKLLKRGLDGRKEK